MRMLFFDSYSGFDTCMALGALCDMTKNMALAEKISKSIFPDAQISTENVRRGSGEGLLVHIDIGDRNDECSMTEAIKLISESRMDDDEKNKMMSWCNTILSAYAEIHGCSEDAARGICMIGMRSLCETSVCRALIESMKIECVAVSGLKKGAKDFEDGAAEYICKKRGIPFVDSDIRSKLITLEGAALLSTLGAEQHSRCGGTVTACGYGAGATDFAETENIVRAVIYDDGESVFELECEIEDVFSEFAVI